MYNCVKIGYVNCDVEICITLCEKIVSNRVENVYKIVIKNCLR